MSKIHLITYATGVSSFNGWGYKLTQNYLVNTIQSKTSKEVVFHTHNLNSIKSKPWFKYIKDFPNIPVSKTNKWWSRDGYWCTWKAFLCQEVFEQMGENDLIYFVDSSQHFREGFNENLDMFFDYVLNTESVFGPAGSNCSHNDEQCLTNIKVWETIWPESIRFMPRILHYPHVMACWLVLKKDSITKYILDQWVNIIKNVKLNNRPIFSFHHTPEQGILNILIYQHNLKIFFTNFDYNQSRNHNLVHKFINKQVLSPTEFIVNPNLIDIS